MSTSSKNYFFFAGAEETFLTFQSDDYILPKLHTVAQMKVHALEFLRVIMLDILIYSDL